MRDDYDQLGRTTSRELIEKVCGELALGRERLDSIARHQGRVQMETHAFIDDSPFISDQYVNHTPHIERGSQVSPDPIRLIDVNSKRELHIPAKAFPEGLNDPDVELRLKREFEFPVGSSNTVGYIIVNGVEYPITRAESMASGIGTNDDILSQITEIEHAEGSQREPTLDSFNQLRSGYNGGNLSKGNNPCAKVNPKDVAKRRAKNKASRRNKRK